ncbi:MAG: PAS domain S-box protein [bacterium]|nr:PAS domain S-box protein [bacterium]
MKTEVAIKDISQHQDVEETLISAQEYVRNIIDSSLDMIISVDSKRRIVEFNRAAQKKFGYCKEEVFGKNGIELVEYLLSLDPSLGVVLCSGYTDRKLQFMVVSEKKYKFIRKPYSIDDLCMAIREVIESKIITKKHRHEIY